MASECKLCGLLGATTCCTVENEESMNEHADHHARQLELIEFTMEKSPTVPNRSEAIARNITDRENPPGRRTKSVLVTFCQELVDSHGKNCGIKCSQCQGSIRSGRSSANTASSLINHACVHLNKDLYACSKCDFKFVSKRGMRSHLLSIHRASSMSGNYVDMTGDHQRDIMDMVKICFEKATEKKLDATTFGKKKRINNQRRAPSLNLAHDFTLKHKLGDLIQCHMCPRSIPFNQQHGQARRLLDHVLWHLDKPIFTCRLCPYSASIQGTISVHLHKIHSVAQSKLNFKDVSTEYYEEISAMFEACFGETKSNRPAVLTIDQVGTRKREKRIHKRFGTNSLLAERKLRCGELAEKFNRSGKLQCRLCHQQLTVANATTTNYTYPMHHAYSHFNKLLISCRQCSYKCITETVIRHHLRAKHGVPSKNQYYDDQTDDFHSDFMDMLSKCYDWDLEPGTSDGSVPIVSQYSTICRLVSRMHGNDLKAARHVLAHDLIKKHVKDGKMTCRVCDQVTKVMWKVGSIDSANLFRHALTHLDSPSWPYRCRLCPHTASNRSNMDSHLRKAHKDAGGNGFEDMSDMFHDDIMKIVSKCYDWSTNVEEMS